MIHDDWYAIKQRNQTKPNHQYPETSWKNVIETSSKNKDNLRHCSLFFISVFLTQTELF